jgi:hypothetical protein
VVWFGGHSDKERANQLFAIILALPVSIVILMNKFLAPYHQQLLNFPELLKTASAIPSSYRSKHFPDLHGILLPICRQQFAAFYKRPGNVDTNKKKCIKTNR